MPPAPNAPLPPDEDGAPDFDLLHSRLHDDVAVACAFDLLMLNGEDLRKQPLVERKSALAKLLIRSREGIQYVEHADGHGERMYEVVCRLGLEGIIAKRATSTYRSGPSKAWLKIKNPKSPAETRAIDGTF